MSIASQPSVRCSQSELVSDARIFASRQLLLIPLLILRAVVVIPLFTPNQLFLMRLIQVWFNYTYRSTLGSFTVLGLYYPSAYEERDDKTCSHLISTALIFCYLGSFFGSIVGCVLATLYLDSWLAFVLVIWGAMVVPGKFVRTSFIARLQFRKIAVFDIIMGLSGVTLGPLGYFLYGFEGYLVGSSIAALAVVIFGLEMFSRINIYEIRTNLLGNIKKGLNLWVTGLLADASRTYDVTLIAVFSVGSYVFRGNYAFALIVVGLVATFVKSANEVFLRSYMKNAYDIKSGAVNRHLMFNGVYFNLGCWILGFVIISVGNYAISMWFPQYSGAMEITYAILISVFLVDMCQYVTVFFDLKEKFIIGQIGWLLSLIAGLMFWLVASFVFSDCERLVFLSRILAGCVFFLFVWLGLFFREDVPGKDLAKLFGFVATFVSWVLLYYLTHRLPAYSVSVLIVGGFLQLFVIRIHNPVATKNLRRLCFH